MRALRVLGADPTTLALPDGLTVVHAGGLVHTGPDSEGVLDLIELQLESGRWIQLIGADEAQEMGLTAGEGAPALSAADRRRLRTWWDGGRIRAAAALDVAGHGSMLVTHAGLTHGFWYEMRSPRTPDEAAEALGKMARDDPERFFRPGHRLGLPRSMAAGPVWAATAEELYPSLTMGVELGKPLPFGQIHGHASPYSWTRGTWRATERDRAGLRLLRDRRHVVGTIAGQPMASIDPELGSAGGVRWEPLVLRRGTLSVAA